MKTKSTCVVVLSRPRTMSSAVAGCLHKMGVDMGEGWLQNADRLNEKGYYEDLRWQSVNKRLAGTRYIMNERKQLPRKTRRRIIGLIGDCATNEIWGIKNPRIAFSFHLIRPVLIEYDVDVRVVHLVRDDDRVIESLMRHSRIAYGGKLALPRYKAGEISERWGERAEARYRECIDEGLTGIEIEAESLVLSTVNTLNKLCAFCQTGVKKRLNVGKAVEWFAPDLEYESEDSNEDSNPDADDKSGESTGDNEVDDDDGNDDAKPK